jgi:hypothetical protein
MSPASQITSVEASALAGVDREDLLQAWRDACDDVASAFAVWCHAPADDARLAFAAYVASADREAAAAALYERACRGAA